MTIESAPTLTSAEQAEVNFILAIDAYEASVQVGEDSPKWDELNDEFIAQWVFYMASVDGDEMVASERWQDYINTMGPKDPRYSDADPNGNI